MRTLFDVDESFELSERYDDSAKVVFFEGDCANLIGQIPSDSIDLIVTSPPYNLGKEYEKITSLSSYLKQQEPIIFGLHRVLANTGSICWQVGNFVDKGEVFPLDVFYYDIFRRLGMKLRNRIIWRFSHGLHASKRFSGRYEVILWFTKSNQYVFNLDSVRIPSKYPGKRHFKGPNRGKPSGNLLGKNPSDIWDIVLQDWEAEVWDIPNVKANHPEKTTHPCQFPIELVERCVLALTDEGGSVLDPYCGVGSTMIAALKHNRRAIGAEYEAEYAVTARRRIEQSINETLPIRPLGKPIYQPSGREKVSQKPIEWGSTSNGTAQ